MASSRSSPGGLSGGLSGALGGLSGLSGALENRLVFVFVLNYSICFSCYCFLGKMWATCGNMCSLKTTYDKMADFKAQIQASTASWRTSPGPSHQGNNLSRSLSLSLSPSLHIYIYIYIYIYKADPRGSPRRPASSRRCTPPCHPFLPPPPSP